MTSQDETRTQTQTPTPAAPAAHDPFAAFRSEMDRLFEQFLGGGRRHETTPGPTLFGGAFGHALSPAVDLKEGAEAVTLTAELPGMKPEDVELSVRGGVLTLKGEKRQEEMSGEGDRRLTERRWGRFERSFMLPDDVDEEKAEARFDHGVLTVTLPKRPHAASGPRKIEIR